jgi:hypothetical protein
MLFKLLVEPASSRGGADGAGIIGDSDARGLLYDHAAVKLGILLRDAAGVVPESAATHQALSHGYSPLCQTHVRRSVRHKCAQEVKQNQDYVECKWLFCGAKAETGSASLHDYLKHHHK